MNYSAIIWYTCTWDNKHNSYSLENAETIYNNIDFIQSKLLTADSKGHFYVYIILCNNIWMIQLCDTLVISAYYSYDRFDVLRW